jgi:hypothetical protein
MKFPPTARTAQQFQSSPSMKPKIFFVVFNKINKNKKIIIVYCAIGTFPS